MEFIIPGSCREVQTCSLKSWGSWSGHVPTNQCSRQSRNRGWNEYNVRYREQDNSCSGIRSSCGSCEYDYRTLCKFEIFIKWLTSNPV
jgi:hypothetical protein